MALPAGYAYQFDQPFREINLPVYKEKTLSIVQFTVPDSQQKGVVLYFHGNRGNIQRYARFAPQFTKNHYEIWMMDYPGFGKSTGKPEEKVLYEDAGMLYKMARSRFSKDRIIIYGKSLGTGLATQLATVSDCKRVILETPYYSMVDLVKHYAFIFPVAWMIKFKFPSHEYFKHIEVPVTIFHGVKDEVIPYRHAQRLAEENPGTELVTIKEGKHNNLSQFPQYVEKLDAILQSP